MRSIVAELNKTAMRLAVLYVFCMLLLSACMGPQHAELSSENRISSSHEAHGIKVVRIGRAVNGMMLDLRFRITDFAQAREVLKQNTPLSIIDQATGRSLAVADGGTVGKLRSVPQRDVPNTVYWMFFVNAAGSVKQGSIVTLIIGDVKIKDITVE